MAEALRRGISYQTIHDITKIDLWFLDKIHNIVQLEEAVKQQGEAYLTPENMKTLKRMGMADKAIAGWVGKSEAEIRPFF